MNKHTISFRQKLSEDLALIYTREFFALRYADIHEKQQEPYTVSDDLTMLLTEYENALSQFATYDEREFLF